MLTITTRATFEACHYLPYYVGACHNLHGHSYKLEVTVARRSLLSLIQDGSTEGMIIDFKDLKAVIHSVIDKYDHANLNGFFTNPTAEIMVSTISTELNQKLRELNVKVVSARLWETENNYAEYTED